MKLVRCRDHGFDCNFEARGKEEEVLEQVAKHAKEVHGLDVTPDLVKQVKKSMKDVKEDKK